MSDVLDRTLHVAVLMGGWANERPVSLMSGEGVATALEERGHEVTRIDMDRQVAARIAEAAPDVVFNALHGVPESMDRPKKRPRKKHGAKPWANAVGVPPPGRRNTAAAA